MVVAYRNCRIGAAFSIVKEHSVSGMADQLLRLGLLVVVLFFTIVTCFAVGFLLKLRGRCYQLFESFAGPTSRQPIRNVTFGGKARQSNDTDGSRLAAQAPFDLRRVLLAGFIVVWEDYHVPA